MKRLSDRQAGNCENATGSRCRCRCRGVLHGSARGPVQDVLPNDPHQVLEIDGPVARVQLELLGVRALAVKLEEVGDKIEALLQLPPRELAVQLNFAGDPVQPPLGRE